MTDTARVVAKQRPPRAEMDPAAWFKAAQKKLSSAESEYSRKDYGNAISALHGAEERIAKALLLHLSFLPNDPGMAAALKVVVGVKYLTPKALGHDWHIQLLDDFGPYLDTFEAIGTAFGNRKPGWRTTKFWSLKVPDYRQKVEAAKKIGPNPAPTLRELEALVADLNTFLDGATAAASKVKPARYKVPKASQVDRAAKVSLHRAGFYANREARRKIEEDALTSFKPVADRVIRSTGDLIVLAHVLLALAVLNVYLYRHHTLGEYPTSEIQYDDSFPMVVKFRDLHAFLKRCLGMAESRSAPASTTSESP
jgi:hypothetical protein